MSQFPSFLADDVTPPAPENALFHVIPVPLEQSVSYGGGTYLGPLSILEASQQLEVFDGFSKPAIDYGIFTAPAIDCEASIDTILKDIYQATASVFGRGKIPVLLGGEHTVTVGVIKALKELPEEVGIIQFDAHADLRESYDDNPYSHACVMKRVFDAGIPLYQVGCRAVSAPEQELRDKENLAYLDARQIYQGNQKSLKLPANFPKKVYVTIDVDGLDPSVVPATGTPVPGGILWYDMLNFLQQIVNEYEVIGFDCVELCGDEHSNQSAFAVTLLIHTFMGMIGRAQ